MTRHQFSYENDNNNILNADCEYDPENESSIQTKLQGI